MTVVYGVLSPVSGTGRRILHLPARGLHAVSTYTQGVLSLKKSPSMSCIRNTNINAGSRINSSSSAAMAHWFEEPFPLVPTPFAALPEGEKQDVFIEAATGKPSLPRPSPFWMLTPGRV